jgi:hypothetical protein
MIISTQVILLLLATFSARIDAGIWEKRGITKSQHIKRAIFRGLFMAIQAHAVYPVFTDFTHFALYWLVQASVWWLLFDALINLFKGKELFYVGRTAFLDRIFWKISDGSPKGAAIMQLTVKISVLLASIILLNTL